MTKGQFYQKDIICYTYNQAIIEEEIKTETGGHIITLVYNPFSQNFMELAPPAQNKLVRKQRITDTLLIMAELICP